MRGLIDGVLVISILLATNVLSLAQEKELKGTVMLSGAWAIYPTRVAWSEGFQKKYPKLKIGVSAGGAGKGAADAITGLVDIGMVSRNPDPLEMKKGIVAVYPPIKRGEGNSGFNKRCDL